MKIINWAKKPFYNIGRTITVYWATKNILRVKADFSFVLAYFLLAVLFLYLLNKYEK